MRLHLASSSVVLKFNIFNPFNSVLSIYSAASPPSSLILLQRKLIRPWREVPGSLLFISSPETSAGVTSTLLISPSICWKRGWCLTPRQLKASCLNAETVQYDMWICMSIRPGLSRAGSSLSLWFVVTMMICPWSPQNDHTPSMKFSKPESVTCLIKSYQHVSKLLNHSWPKKGNFFDVFWN